MAADLWLMKWFRILSLISVFLSWSTNSQCDDDDCADADTNGAEDGVTDSFDDGDTDQMGELSEDDDLDQFSSWLDNEEYYIHVMIYCGVGFLALLLMTMVCICFLMQRKEEREKREKYSFVDYVPVQPVQAQTVDPSASYHSLDLMH